MSTMQTTQPLPQLRSLLTRVVEQSENPIQCDFQFASQDIFFMLLESLLECFDRSLNSILLAGNVPANILSMTTL